MKRLLVLFAVLVPLSLLIAGCGQGGGSGASSTAPKTPEEQTERMKAMMMQDKQAAEKRGDVPGAPGQGAKK